MSILFDKEHQVFLLHTPSSTYVIQIFDGKYLLHGGWFPTLHAWSGSCASPLADRAFAPVPQEQHGRADFSQDTQPMEFPVAGGCDFRAPAIEALSKDGTVALNLLYDTYRITKGKKTLSGLPATYVESGDDADTLEIDIRDSLTGITVTLCYTVWNKYDAICRHTVVSNAGTPVVLRKVMSASLDFAGSRYKMMQLSGAHARERRVILRDLVPGVQGVESRRCTSSHQQNPFIALASPSVTEREGEVFGFNFVYSGNFSAQVEVDQFNMSRVQLGINPYNFDWKLENGESFCTPEVVMVRSGHGLGEMSRTYHDLYRDHLCRGKWKKEERPVVINNWEATYFDFNAQKLFALADTAAKQGIELFVLDDGWFGRRNDDRSSLGDWFVNMEKLPKGLTEIADGIHSRGMKFGLWFEPEMISPDSDLYRAHPDWCLHIKGRPGSLGRHQLVLDMSRDDVVDYLTESLSAVLSSVKIDYVKWDFNRSPTEVGSENVPADEQMKTSHKFYLGLYRLLETLTARFPDVLFESCSGGGGRFDAGMLYYMPQTWTSDNTDALSRTSIQLGTSLAYPASAMSCHVSAVPNHQIGRITSLSLRGHVAMAGTFGYELDLNKLSATELEEIKEQVSWYKRIRKTVQFGDLFRLETPWNTKAATESATYTAWEHLAKDKSLAVVTVAWTYAEANAESIQVKLSGLEPGAKYRITSQKSATMQDMAKQFPFEIPDSEKFAVPDGTVAYGDELMYCGLRIVNRPLFGGSVQLLLEKV